MTPLTSPRLLRAAAVSACLALAGLAGTSSPALAAKTCNVKTSPKYPNTNPGGYFTSLKVTGVSCTSGKKLMVAFYKDPRSDPATIRHAFALTAVRKAVIHGIEEHGDDFALQVEHAPGARAAGETFDSHDPAVTDWYRRVDENGEEIDLAAETGSSSGQQADQEPERPDAGQERLDPDEQRPLDPTVRRS